MQSAGQMNHRIHRNANADMPGPIGRSRGTRQPGACDGRELCDDASCQEPSTAPPVLGRSWMPGSGAGNLARRIVAGLSAVGSAFESAGRYFERGPGEWLPRYGYLFVTQIDLAFPSLRLIGAKPFNGQNNRLKIFHGILDACDVSIMVETGTFRGTTTEYMGRRFSGKIYTCEVRQRYFEYARRRLEEFANIEVRLSDSKRLLEYLFGQPLLPGTSIFFYLDAHWNREVPLLDEISLILNSNIPAVVMIDDFEVPFDEGYGFDTFGQGKRLSLRLLRDFRERIDGAYFPSAPAATESGPRRGCMVFTTSDELDRRLKTLSGLRRATPRDWDLYDYSPA